MVKGLSLSAEPEKSEPGVPPELEENTESDKVVEPEEKVCNEPPTDYYTQLKECATILANKLDADVIIYSGYIESPYDRTIINLCSQQKNRRNVFLIMVTGGGDPNAAFRIARYLQLKYEKFYFCASGFCKSSGTLIAVGANELIISDNGELGPLDVQIFKKDELGEMQSGWTADSAVKYLFDRAFTSFEKWFLDLRNKSRRTITVPTAAKIAVDLSVGLIAPILQQIDPLHVGEMSRALDISWKYGRMLFKKHQGKNIDEIGLGKLISDYPSHGFVIDRTTAEKIFNCVREPSIEEQNLLSLLGNVGLQPADEGIVDMLSNPKPIVVNEELPNETT